MVNSHVSAAMASVLLCLQLLGVVLALGHGLTDEPRKVPCVAPTRWEGRVVRFEQNSGWNTRSIVSYDAVKRRVRFLEEKKSIIPCKRFYEYIRLYADGVQYKIEQVSKACKKSPLNEPFDPFDIPANSTFEDDYIIGGPGDQLSAQEWSDRKPSRMLERWVGVYTVKNCYPVQETNIKKYNVTSSTRFFDIKLGIKDPSVFVPPSGCKATTPTEFSQC